MNDEKSFSVNRGCEGCLVSVICLMLFVPCIFAFTEWLKLLPRNVEEIIFACMWLFALGLGGYWAARRGRTTGWTNSLVVGIFAQLFVVGQLTDFGEGRLLERLSEMVADP